MPRGQSGFFFVLCARRCSGAAPRRTMIGDGGKLDAERPTTLQRGGLWPRMVRAPAANQLRMPSHETAPFQSSRLVALVGTELVGVAWGV